MGGFIRRRAKGLNRSTSDFPTASRFSPITNLYNECVHLGGIERAAAKLIRLDPNDPDLTISQAGAYLVNHRLALSLRTFRCYVNRWPKGGHADHAHEAIDTIAPIAIEEAAEYGFTGEDALELMEWRQESQALLAQHECDEARAKIAQLLERRPDFVSAVNNLSLVAMVEGKLDEAIEIAGRVLARQPDNFHALGNQVRFHVLRGRLDEARAYAERLRMIDWEIQDAWMKKAARSWFEMWERIAPDHPNLERYRARVTSIPRPRSQ
jgi:tetratricopeptide (TPR) repeat protein